MFSKAILLVAPVVLLSACAPQAYETEPVVLKTAQGDVVCQLYTKEIVMWDRSILHPKAMSKIDADKLCSDEGRRQKGA